ncbi:MAG: 5-formyltetrahydrofolate cyclo-ligase [Nitrosomonadales bacterium]|nr:5-formyltetrahydrofolate cyclo-ligase [Nitrosomonadales bacterium]
MTQGLKQIIRQRILTQREQLSVTLRRQYSAEIAQRIAQLPQYKSARTVLAYMNFGAEFASEILVRQALLDGKKLLLPKVDTVTRELDIYRVEDVDAQLAPGAYGIREPLMAHCAKVGVLSEVDFILLPGVAFGRDGARLGYGGGFYDKLLAGSAITHRPALVAGAYSMQIVEGIPQEATDRKVEWLVTENETIDCGEWAR